MSQIITPFERYQPIIDDWGAFCHTLQQPLPTCLWANPLRVTPSRLADLLAADGLAPEPLPWHAGGFRLPPDFKPGYHWSYLAGLCHVQEEVSMLPVLLLDPQPWERVLDLCAAPGGKTAQIGVQMGNRGTVIANDINTGRMRAVRHILERLGLINVATTIWDGSSYPPEAGLFDRVLVDAPCSCEGTSRKKPGVVNRVSAAVSTQMQGLQQALLRKAVQLCRPGGRIVYATCTYAPEENEAVVDAILRENDPDVLTLLPAEIAGVSAAPGLTNWQGQTFDADLRHTRRIWPHQNDTGGFFVAVLQKEEGATAPISPPTTIAAPDAPDPAAVTALARFGIDPATVSTGAIIHRPGRRRVYLSAEGMELPAQPLADAAGLLLTREGNQHPKLTTAGAMHLGRYATQNQIALTRRQVEAYIIRRPFEISAAQMEQCTGPGYVLMQHHGFTLGVGALRLEAGQPPQVASLYPKGWSPVRF